MRLSRYTQVDVEVLPANYRLTVRHSKYGGEATITLPHRVTWSSRWSMDRNPEAVKIIKDGLFQILSLHSSSGIIGLLVDQFFRTGDWVISEE